MSQRRGGGLWTETADCGIAAAVRTGRESGSGPNGASRLPPRPVTGIFESEISLPVQVHYAVDDEGRVELTHVLLTSEAERLFAPKCALRWPSLSHHDLTALHLEAEEDAHHSANCDLHNPL